jgi:hypothetical protein
MIPLSHTLEGNRFQPWYQRGIGVSLWWTGSYFLELCDLIKLKSSFSGQTTPHLFHSANPVEFLPIHIICMCIE